MALPEPGDAAFPTPGQIRDQILSDIAYGFAKVGLAANVLPGSDHYIRATAIAQRIALALANQALALRDLSPLTAEGDALVRLAGVFGVRPRPASPASGFVVIQCLGTVSIPAGFRATSPSGLKYETVGLISNAVTGTPIEVRATTPGAASNVAAGVKLTWDSAAIGALIAQTTVDAGGLDGGADADDQETLRSRLLRRLSFPEAGGNAAQIVGWAEESSAAVEAAYCYAAARGPATYDVVVTSTSRDRAVSPATLGTVASYLLGKMPGHADLNLTSVRGETVDVVLNAALPLPVQAGGAGGGWRDAKPWPSTVASAPTRILAVSGNVLRVNSPASDAPYPGASFGVWDQQSETMVEYVIASVAGNATAGYLVTLAPGAPYGFLAPGLWLSTGAFNLTAYADTFAALMRAMGPGEKTTRAYLLPRSRRQPTPDMQAPYALTGKQIAEMMRAHPEMLDLNYGAIYAAGTNTVQRQPTVAATAADAPGVLTLGQLALRRAPT